MRDEIVVPFSALSEGVKQKYAPRSNWKVDGEDGDFNAIVDPRYGTFVHTAILNLDGTIKFDKLNLIWSTGVYVVPIRVTPQNKAEFLVAKEVRPLLRDKNGKQGNVMIENIPQGLIKFHEGENPAEAAIRELREETGYIPTALAKIGDICFSPANSESVQPYYLALIPYDLEAEEQVLEDTERIEKGKWYSLQELEGKGSRDGITTIGLALARRVLRPDLIS